MKQSHTDRYRGASEKYWEPDDGKQHYLLYFSAYAAIHNDGGEIVVTGRMKRFFWHKYYEPPGRSGEGRTENCGKTNENARLDTEADFWMFMALKKEGSTIKIPRRRFLGTSPEVEKAVREIVEENLTEYFTIEYNIIRK